jgi:hypothetical protein
MAEQLFEVTLTATGEVRDADGNLLSSTPVESVVEMTRDQVIALTGEDPTP